MKISTLGPDALIGMSNVTSTSLASGPSPAAAMLADVEAPIANPGTGIDAEASEPLPSHVMGNGPSAVAAPAPSAMPISAGPTGEPPSLYAPGFGRPQGA